MLDDDGLSFIGHASPRLTSRRANHRSKDKESLYCSACDERIHRVFGEWRVMRISRENSVALLPGTYMKVGRLSGPTPNGNPEMAHKKKLRTPYQDIGIRACSLSYFRTAPSLVLHSRRSAAALC